MRRRALALGLAAAVGVAALAGGFLVRTARVAAAFPFLQIEAAHAEHVPSYDGTEPLFVLLIGSDAREDKGEDPSRTRADSIHVVSFDPATGRSTIIGIPRDSYVEIPGVGTAKINGAMVDGGPELLVQTVEALTGITLDYWVLTSFTGFAGMIDDIGGLTVDVPFEMRDSFSGADFDPGVQLLDGRQALAFARDRHSIPAGDFGRSENQGRLMLAAVAQLRQVFLDDPGELLTYIAAGLRQTRTSLPMSEVLRLAFTVTKVDAAAVQNVVVPGYAAMAGTSSIVQLAPSAPTIFADMADDGHLEDVNVPTSPTASLID